MQVIIIEDNPSAQALLEQVVRSFWPDAQIKIFIDARFALAQWSACPHLGLLIIASSISGTQAPILIQSVRKHTTHIPIIIIDDRADRASVLLARRFGVESYLTKPIQPVVLSKRLREVFTNSKTPTHAPAPESPADFVRDTLHRNDVALPIPALQVEAAPALPALPLEQRAQLLAQWAREPALVARLLGLVNQSYYLHDAAVIETFAPAAERLGFEGLIYLIQEIGLYPGSHLDHPILQALNQKYLQDCLELSQILVELHRYSNFDLPSCKTASILFRCGELVVLQILQRWVDAGGILAEPACAETVSRFSADAGNRIKAAWHLPMPIRMRVGATYMLPQSALKIDSIAMRVAGLLLQGANTGELDKLLGSLGISSALGQTLKAQATAAAPTEGLVLS